MDQATALMQLTDEPDALGGNDYVMSRNMAEKLHQHFPGHLWAVTCDGKQGIATIRNLALSGEWGYVLHLRRLNGDPHMNCVMRAGGEILERYAIKRRMSAQGVRDSIDALPLMANGSPIFDPTGTRSKIPHVLRDAIDKANGVHALAPTDHTPIPLSLVKAR